MADVKLLKEKSLATIDAANTILQNYPEFKNTNTDRSLTLFSTSVDPISFIIDILKHTEGYDKVLNIIAKFLIYGIEPLEVAVKALIIAHIKDFISCSFNPFITDELLREGIAFNLGSLDLTNMFNVCPLDPKDGYHFYFGVEKDGSEVPDDLNQSQDFNAFLWYMRNRSIGRQVWYGSRHQKERCNSVAPNEKLRKSDGIITLEYSEFFETLSDAEGYPCYLQVPRRDCVHVFIGNTAPYVPEKTLSDVLSATNRKLAEKEKEYNNCEGRIEEYDIQLASLDNSVGDIGEEEYFETYDRINDLKTDAVIESVNLSSEIQNLLETKSRLELEYKESVKKSKYRDITKNYYYHKTLMQFNTDLVLSMNLFDTKVLVAQILENLTGNISIKLDLNYSRRVIQEEVLKMVKSVLETDDTAVSDCFFSFSNDDYDAMLRKTDLMRAGVYSNSGTVVSNAKIDSESLLSMLNDINPDSSEEEQISIYTRFFNNISEDIATTEGNVGNEFSLSLKLNILEELLTQLAIAICLSIISPKLYMVIAINLKIMGKSVDFNLKDFMQMYKQLIVNLIRMVRNEIIKFFLIEIRKILLGLAKEVGIELVREQVEFYISLLQQCVACYRIFKFGRKVYDWEMGDISADIINEESDSPKNAEC